MFNAEAVIRRLGAPARELCCDSRRVRRGSVFVAYPGHVHDGRRHIAEAIRGGAAGVLWDPHEFAWPKNIDAPNAPVPSLSEHVGLLADAVYGEPSRRLFVAAVTGTNGKTTTAHFVAQLLVQSGISGGIIGTLGAGLWGKKMTSTDNTTPEAITIHGFLRDFATAGAQAAVVEASSHGIAQGRLGGVRIAAAALTNIGRDHLDYHGDLKTYQQVKLSLLQTEGLQTAIINADDAHCAAAVSCIHAEQVWTFGTSGETLRLISATEKDGEQIISLDGEQGRKKVRLPVLGRHNIDNFMAAILVAQAAGANWEDMRPQELIAPQGRLQRINPGGSPAIYVDYAHTPDALHAALTALKHRSGRLWVVFGCGGERDSGKRRLMGRTAGMLADVAIVTDDNPRGESAAEIRAQVMGGGLRLREVADRSVAIATAIEEASVTDTILIAGKGHEEYQEIDGQRRRFSDAETALTVSRARSGRC